jgi:hypothetical protein
MVAMTQDEADAKAKELYGPRAFVKISHFGAFDLMLDQSWSEGKKQYYQAWLMGWSYASWEEAFNMAEQRYPQAKIKPEPPRQLELFSRPPTGDDADGKTPPHIT